MKLLTHRNNGGSSASAGEPSSAVDERVRVERGRPGRRRVLVIVDERMSAAKAAAELHELADRLEVL